MSDKKKLVVPEKAVAKVSKLSSKELRDIEFRVTAGLNRLYDHSPFFYHFLKNVPKQFQIGMDYAACIAMDMKSRRCKLLIDPERTEFYNVSDFVGLLQHESLHICYEHLLDPKYAKRSTAPNFNRACDYIINDHVPEIVSRYPRIRENLAKARMEISDTCNGEFDAKLSGHPDEIEKFMKTLSPEQYKLVKPKLEAIIEKYRRIEPFTFGCTKPAIEHVKEVQNLDFKTTNSEELYNLLFKKKDQEASTGDKDQDQMIRLVSTGEPQDDHSNIDGQGEGSEPVEMDELTKEEIRKFIKDAANEALESQKSLGNMPANLSKTIFEMLKSKTNYIQVVNSFVTSIRDSDQIRTWTRRHRKYPSQTPGKKREFKPNLAIILDSSGSMWSDKIAQLMAGEISALKDVCESLTLIVGDTQEQYRLDLKDKDFDPKRFKLKGGGGTHLQFGWDAARELKADGVIVHTDGYIMPVEDHGIQSLFFIYPGGHEWEPEKYRNYLIDDCDV